MIKNSLMKFIDSCVGNIARKIEDEFRESDHPRDKGGKFTSKGGEGRGGGKKEKYSSGKPMNISVSAGGDTEGLEAEAEKYGVKAELGESSHGETSVKLSGSKEDIRRYLEEKFYGSEEEAREFSPEAYEESEESSSSKPAKKVDAKASRHIHQVLEDEIRQIAENSDDKDEFKINLGAFLEDYVTDDMADTDERAMDNFGYDKETVHAVAEEMKGEIDSIADDIFEEDDDSVTGPEDRDYMNEEDDDDDLDEETVGRNLNAQLSLYNNHPDWMTEEDMSSIKKDMHRLGMDEEVELMGDKKALKNFQKQAQSAVDNLDDNEIEELLESVGVASHRIRQGDVYKMVKRHIKDDPIRLHAAMRKQGLLKFIK